MYGHTYIIGCHTSDKCICFWSWEYTEELNRGCDRRIFFISKIKDLVVVKFDAAKLENWIPWTEGMELKPVHGIQFSELGTAKIRHIFF